MVRNLANLAEPGDCDVSHDLRLAVVVMGIAARPRPGNCWRSIDLVSRILQSRHQFAGLTAVLDEYGVIQRHISRLSDERGADIVLVVNDTQGPRDIPLAAEAMRHVPLLDGMVLPDPRIGFVGIIRLGLPLRAMLNPTLLNQ